MGGAGMPGDIREHLHAYAEELAALPRVRSIDGHPKNRTREVPGYVLRHGREYESLMLTPDEMARALRAIDRAGSGRSWRTRQCFWNAQRIVLYGEDAGLRYVEGYVLPRDGGGLIYHAWATLDGKVLDLTLRRKKPRGRGRFRDRVLGAFDDRAYFGVEIPAEDARDLLVETGNAGPLLDDWKRGWPLLRADGT
jgi:hypothetical protein